MFEDSESEEIMFIQDRDWTDKMSVLNEVVEEIKVNVDPDVLKARTLFGVVNSVVMANSGVEPVKRVKEKRLVGSKVLDEYPIVMGQLSCSYQSDVKLVFDKDERGKKVIVSGPGVNQEVLFETERILDGYKPSDICSGDFLYDKVRKASDKLGVKFNKSMVENVRGYLVRDLLGFGKVEPLLFDPKVKEIICDGPGKFIKVRYAKVKGEIPTNVKYDSNKEIELFLKKMILAGKGKFEEGKIVNVKINNLTLRTTIGEAYSTFKIRRIHNLG